MNYHFLLLHINSYLNFPLQLSLMLAPEVKETCRDQPWVSVGMLRIELVLENKARVGRAAPGSLGAERREGDERGVWGVTVPVSFIAGTSAPLQPRLHLFQQLFPLRGHVLLLCK